jgi:hypothetical protein
MKQQMLKERVELLSIGETLGFPRLAYGPPRHEGERKRTIPAGQPNWEKFCAHAHSTRIPAALRNGRILKDAGIVPYNPKALPAVTPVVEDNLEADHLWETPVVDLANDELLAAFDRVTPAPSIRQQSGEEMVKPRRSAAAERQKRWRDKRRAASQ